VGRGDSFASEPPQHGGDRVPKQAA
jgi:hypothetical protein